MDTAKKQEIRLRIKAQRETLGKDTMDLASDAITRAFNGAGLLADLRSVLCYLPVNNEVETKRLIADLRAMEKQVFVPAFDNDSGLYVFAKFNGWDKQELGPYGVKQPVDSGETEKIDLAILPGLAFDLTGNRLGYGKGVYDKLLAKSTAFRVGLAYDFQVLESLPVEEHDLKMDMVITEKRVIRF